jgi:hypothetical protein
MANSLGRANPKSELNYHSRTPTYCLEKIEARILENFDSEMASLSDLS